MFWTPSTFTKLANFKVNSNNFISNDTAIVWYDGDDQTLQKSTDMASTWTTTTVTAISKGFVNLYDGSIMLGNNGTYLARSTNQGTSWTQVTGAGSRTWATSLKGMAMCPTLAVAGVNSGKLHLSSDNGVTWAEATASPTATWGGVVISSDGNKIAAAAYGSYIYLSTDRGVTWTALTASTTRNWLTLSANASLSTIAGCLHNAMPSISTNGGTTWAQPTVNSPYDPVPGWVNTAGTTIWLGYRDWSNISTDSGATWTRKNSTGGGPLHFSADGTKGIAYISTSTDSGTTWNNHQKISNLPGMSIATNASGSVIVSGMDIYTDGRISTDAGLTWVSMSGATPQRVKINTNGSMLVGVNNYTPSYCTNKSNWSTVYDFQCKGICVSGDGTKIFADGLWGGGIWSSTDSGSSWSQVEFSFSNAVGIVCNTAGTTIIVLDQIGNYTKSTDSGANWSSSSWSVSPDNSLTTDGFLAIPDLSKLVVVEYGGLKVSTDSGANWSSKSIPWSYSSQDSIALSSDGSMLLGAPYNSGYIYTSTDLGTNWVTVTDIGAKAWRGAAASPSNLFVNSSANSAIYRYGVESPASVNEIISFSSSGGTITLTQDMAVSASGEVTLQVNNITSLNGEKIITVQPGGKLKLSAGQQITVLQGTLYKLYA